MRYTTGAPSRALRAAVVTFRVPSESETGSLTTQFKVEPGTGISPDRFALFRISLKLPDGPDGTEPEYPATVLTLSDANTAAAIVKQLVAVVVLMFGLAAGTLGNAGPAAAHAARISSDPAENASLTTAPPRVSATFNEEMQPEFAAMTVIGPDGDMWSTGEPQVNGAVISVGVRPLGPAGTYTVNYRATSADGHVVSGSWPFQLTVAGTGTSAPPAAAPAPAAAASGNSENADAIPVWPFYVGAVLIVGAGALLAARRRR